MIVLLVGDFFKILITNSVQQVEEKAVKTKEA